jgi:hypothetical protein
MRSCVVNPSVGDEVGKKLWVNSHGKRLHLNNRSCSQHETHQNAQNILYNHLNLVVLYDRVLNLQISSLMRDHPVKVNKAKVSAPPIISHIAYGVIITYKGMAGNHVCLI